MNFVKCICYIYWDDCVAILLYSLNVISFEFSDIKPTLHSWNKCHFSLKMRLIKTSNIIVGRGVSETKYEKYIKETFSVCQRSE